jgi:hypothetical protein
MTRIRLTIQATVEYDADPDDYPSSDPQEMLKVDIDNLKGDPMLVEELGGKFEVTGTLV